VRAPGWHRVTSAPLTAYSKCIGCILSCFGSTKVIVSCSGLAETEWRWHCPNIVRVGTYCLKLSINTPLGRSRSS
jgi:hypothetical protein